VAAGVTLGLRQPSHQPTERLADLAGQFGEHRGRAAVEPVATGE
jgi:hypothetical protein